MRTHTSSLARAAAPAPTAPLAVSGCAGAEPAQAPSEITRATPGAAAYAPIDMAAFETWKRDFRKEALAAGISGATFDAALGEVVPNTKILDADQAQPEVSRAVWQYIDGAVNAARITGGRELLAQHQSTLSQVERDYGVAGQYLVAIWGMESNFGANTGGYNVFEALATLAFEGRRAEFAKSELIAALRIVERGDKTPDKMIGSWSGALGDTQFLPSTYLQYAVDEDGDGHRDLFDSVPDILASTANYLRESGWKTGEGWGEEVKLPPGFEYGLADPTIQLPMTRWHEMGVQDLEGTPVDGGDAEAAIFLPAGHKGPAFLVRNNFRVFLRYNNSTPYALAVGHLSDRLIGEPPISALWPLEERPLTLSERKELQSLLNQLGFPVGTPDGIIGAGTRAGIRGYQKSIGVPADGFATVSLLERMRKDTGSAQGVITPSAIPAMAPIPNPE